jgi:uncharacterized membrane protein
MAKVPTQVVIAAYHDEGAADEVADALKKAKRRLLVYYRNVAVIRKTEKGKVKIKETGDMSGGVGAGVGAVVGGALGILAGPAGLAAGAAAGAVIGGAGAALHDAGIPNERLEQIGSVLQPGNSAIIAIFQEAKVDKTTMKEIDKGAAEAVYSLSTDIGDTLRAGQDVAYVFAVTESWSSPRKASPLELPWLLKKELSTRRLWLLRKAPPMKPVLLPRKARSSPGRQPLKMKLSPERR